jgi:omega-hydroxy-beta-dihydromenaquinone-9 sulfotransferase
MHHKKIRNHIIMNPPVFILGYYRSGTSYLHEFFTQDDRLGYHTNFQMIFPELMLTWEKVLSPVLEFISRLFNLQDPVHRTPLSFRFPGEEDAAMTTALNPRGAQWGFFFPKKMNDYFRKYVLFENIPATEKAAWTRDYVYLLKKISLASHNKQLVLKSPPNTARIKLLLSLFPEAKFILIHRNPYEVYASNKRFWKVTQRMYALGGTGSFDINAMIQDTFAQTMQRYLLEKNLIPHGQLVELAYDDFLKNPVENMRSAYATLHLNDFNYCENKMISFAARQKTFKVLDHSLRQDEKKEISQKLETIIKHWNYPL